MLTVGWSLGITGRGFGFGFPAVDRGALSSSMGGAAVFASETVTRSLQHKRCQILGTSMSNEGTIRLSFRRRRRALVTKDLTMSTFHASYSKPHVILDDLTTIDHPSIFRRSTRYYVQRANVQEE